MFQSPERSDQANAGQTRGDKVERSTCHATRMQVKYFFNEKIFYYEIFSSGPTSTIPVRDNLTSLDLTVQQLEHLNKT